MELILKDEDVKKLDSLLGDIPARWSIPAINFISQLYKSQIIASAKSEKQSEKDTPETGQAVAVD